MELIQFLNFFSSLLISVVFTISEVIYFIDKLSLYSQCPGRNHPVTRAVITQLPGR